MTDTGGQVIGVTHALCDSCWTRREGPIRLPYRIPPDERQRETCCRCGAVTAAGIYSRKPDPLATRCDHSKEMTVG